MRVAYICADAGVPVFGTKGCSVHVQEIIHQFLARDCQVKLFALRTGGENVFTSPGLSVREFSIANSTAVETRELNQIDAAEKVARQLTSERFGLVYERYSLWSSKPICRARQLGIPAILEVNAPLIEEQLEHRQLVHQAEAVAIRNQVFHAATTIIAVSEHVARYVRHCLPEPQHAKVHVVPNGVDTQRFHPEVPPLASENRFTVGFLGTLKPWHGLESLLNAFQLVHSQRPDTRLHIIGDGPMRESLQQKVTQDFPQMQAALHWVGAVHPRDVPGHLTAIDVAVAPYLDATDFYFSPLKVYEYMAAGRAVVASSIGQLQTVLEHGRTGMLYPPGDVRALAACLLQLIDQPQLCQQLGRAARQAAISKHSWQQTLDTILQLARADADQIVDTTWSLKGSMYPGEATSGVSEATTP